MELFDDGAGCKIYICARMFIYQAGKCLTGKAGSVLAELIAFIYCGTKQF